MKLLLVGLAVGIALPARAQSVAELRMQLLQGEEAKAEAAADALGKSADPKAVDALLDGLAFGASPKLQAQMIGAVGGKKDARALDVLKFYAKNRNVELRKKALGALAQIAEPKVTSVLLEALSDPVEEVRAAAEKALGERRERSAEAKLLQAMKRKDWEAAIAIGKLGTPELAHRLSEMLGEMPDALLCASLGEMLKRADFGPENIRMEIVKTLAKVPGLDATTALIEYVASSEKDKARPSRQEAQKIVEQRSSAQ
jgi:HEAT repeat protein